jgi:hypothetical protein
MPVALLLLLLGALLTLFPTSATLRAQAPSGASAASALDFEYYRTRVEPILLAKREGNVRCATCHTKGTPMRLQELSPGATTWNEKQSRQNFQVIVSRVVPHSINNSKFLLHPLASEAGGTFYHSGGKHWNSFLNPEWQVLAHWVCGRKATEKMHEVTGACGE